MPEVRFPEKAQPGWPAAVVLGAYYTGVNLTRYLVRRGVTTYCTDNDRAKQGFRSVYGKTVQCPDPDLQPTQWLAFMLDLARKVGGKPVLIPSADSFVLAMAKHADELANAYVFCHDTIALQGMLSTKVKQYDLTAAHGMPVPRTRYAQTVEEVVEFGRTAQFPCVIKPARSYDWANVPRDHPLANRKVVPANTPKELGERYRVVAEVGREVVVQEMIEGPDTAKLVYLSCYSTDRRRIARCMARAIRTAPIHFGNSSVLEPVEDAATDALCDRVLQSMGYAGLCEISLKRDSRDGRVRMIEANPRFTGGSNAAIPAGVDLGWLHYLDLIGQRVEMVTPNGRDFRYIYLIWDCSTIVNYRREGLLPWRELIRSYRPPVAFYDVDLRNWRVTIGTFIAALKVLIGRPIRRLFVKRPPF